MSDNPISVYDLTIGEDICNKEKLVKLFSGNCKKWCFQLEEGENTGYRHYQCRISLTVKKRLSTMIGWVHKEIGNCRVSPTNNKCSTEDIYVTKEETRIDGPWSDKTEINENKIPERFRGDVIWQKWQKAVIDEIEMKPDDRTINVIVDDKGNMGKSFLVGWLSVHNKARKIPQQKDIRDIMRLVMDAPKSRCYFIDLPRAISERDQHSIYAGLEELKNGYAYDDRYHFKEEWFEPPHVWVFSNKRPNVGLLSKDRWIIWEIIDEGIMRVG